MTPDLKYLLFSVILTFVQVVIAAALANQAVGLPTLAGNREEMPPLTGIAGRAKRAHLNMVENLVLFAALVLIAVAGNKANAMTATGAMIFGIRTGRSKSSRRKRKTPKPIIATDRANR